MSTSSRSWIATVSSTPRRSWPRLGPSFRTGGKMAPVSLPGPRMPGPVPATAKRCSERASIPPPIASVTTHRPWTRDLQRGPVSYHATGFTRPLAAKGNHMATTVQKSKSDTTSAKSYPIYVAGEWQTSQEPLAVRNPFSGEVVGVTYQASRDQLEQAIVGAERAFEVTRTSPTFERVAQLKAMAAGLKERRDEVAKMIAAEAGKPIRDAEVEADRGVFTLETAAEEAKRIDGEVIPLDLLPSSKGRAGVVRRFPIGPIAGISPFNFPLNLALHKLAPALASGNPIVLKPPSRDPLTMLLVAEILDEAGVPKGAVSVLPMDREVGDAMVEDDRFKLLS